MGYKECRVEKFRYIYITIGTTLQFTLSIYEDDKCIKAIDCIEVRQGILDDTLQKNRL